MSDRFKDLLVGPYLKFNSFEAARLYVRNIYPDSVIEKLDKEGTFSINGKVVAHSWLTGRKKEVWHLRLRSNEGI